MWIFQLKFQLYLLLSFDYIQHDMICRFSIACLICNLFERTTFAWNKFNLRFGEALLCLTMETRWCFGGRTNDDSRKFKINCLELKCRCTDSRTIWSFQSSWAASIEVWMELNYFDAETKLLTKQAWRALQL